jgi:hypothetical protein
MQRSGKCCHRRCEQRGRPEPKRAYEIGDTRTMIFHREGEATMLDLDQAIRERHSTRLFLPQPVPRELVNEALALAQDGVDNRKA